MRLADLQLDSPRQGLRSSTASVPDHDLHHHGFALSSVPDSNVDWDAWTHASLHHEGPIVTAGATAALDEFFLDSMHHRYPAARHDLGPSGLPEQEAMALDDQAQDDLDEISPKREFAIGPDGPKRARTRLQSRTSKSQSSPSQPYPTASPARSRSSSFRGTHASDGFFASPFPASAVYHTPDGTMDPAHSVRSSSPSSASSAPLSRVGSSSASSSVHGGEAVAPSIPRRSHQKNPSVVSTSGGTTPIKKPRGGRKLTDLDKRNICRFRDANPTLKQDIIAERFKVERSTVSKILKNKETWLALDLSDDDGVTLRATAATTSSLASTSVPPAQHPPPPPVSPLPTSMPRIVGGRYPDLETALGGWARAHVERGHFLTDEELHDRALALAAGIKGCDSFRASSTWLEGFKNRAGIAGGSFIDLLSPNTVARIQREQEEEGQSAGEDDDGEDEAELVDDGDDDKDDDFHATAKGRKAARGKRAAPTGQPAPPLLAPAPRRQLSLVVQPSHDMGMPGQVSPSASLHSQQSRMDVDAHTPLRTNFPDLSAEATPTHSRHQTYRDTPSVSSTPADSYGTYCPSPSFGYSSYPPQPAPATSAELPYSMHSPYLSQSQPASTHLPPIPFAPYQSGANSPAPHHQLSQSLSYSHTASSSSSSLIFPTSTPSLYSSYSSHSNPNSLPSTPATGYFGHGPDGTQSQLQAAFLVHQNSAPTPPAASSHAPPAPIATRRATISGGLPFNPYPHQLQGRQGSLKPLSQLSAQPAPGPAQVTLDQALHSLQQALEYLSHDGQGIVTPRDIVALADVKGKLAQAAQHQQLSSSTSSAASSHYSQPAPPPPSSSQLKARMKMTRTGSHHGHSHSHSLSGGVGMGRRSQSSTSLLSAFDNEQR